MSTNESRTNKKLTIQQINLLNKIKLLPEVLENKILNYLHSYQVYKINNQIKSIAQSIYLSPIKPPLKLIKQKLSMYEYWEKMGLKKIPTKYWLKISRHHKKYHYMCLWNGIS